MNVYGFLFFLQHYVMASIDKSSLAVSGRIAPEKTNENRQAAKRWIKLVRMSFRAVKSKKYCKEFRYGDKIYIKFVNKK